MACVLAQCLACMQLDNQPVQDVFRLALDGQLKDEDTGLASSSQCVAEWDRQHLTRLIWMGCNKLTRADKG